MRSRIAAPSRSQRSIRSTLWRRSQSRSVKRSAALVADVGGDERHVVVAQRTARRAGSARSSRSQLALLGAEEADAAREQPRVAPVGDHDLVLAALGRPAQARDHAELEQQVLHVAREPPRCRTSTRPGSCLRGSSDDEPSPVKSACRKARLNAGVDRQTSSGTRLSGRALAERARRAGSSCSAPRLLDVELVADARRTLIDALVDVARRRRRARRRPRATRVEELAGRCC